MAFRLSIAQINVTDLNLAWRFYVDTLGMTGRWSLGRGKAFELDVQDRVRVLVYPVSLPAVKQYPEGAGVTLVFATEDLEQTIHDWRQKEVTFIPAAWADRSTGIATSPFGRFIAFADPFGNVHELIESSD